MVNCVRVTTSAKKRTPELTLPDLRSAAFCEPAESVEKSDLKLVSIEPAETLCLNAFTHELGELDLSVHSRASLYTVNRDFLG